MDQRLQRSIDRQAHLVAGILIVTALTLSNLVAPGWIWLAALPGFGLLLDALSGFCPMTAMLRHMPWNRA